jgi:Zn-dependent protease/CBS domain-containing protein
VLGRPFGIPVVVSPSWFLVAGLITWVFQPTVARQVPDLGAGAWLVAFLFAVLLYASVLVHELSHSLTALRMGLPVRRITLHLLGGVSEIQVPPPTPGRSLLVSAAGPAVNFVLAGIGLAVLSTVPGGTVTYVLAYALTSANLIVGVFNLLPGLPLDGGHVVEAAVWKLTGRRTTGTLAAGWAGRGLAVVMVAGPLLLAYAGGRQPSLVTLLWGLLLGSFVWVGASAAIRGAHARNRLPGVSARTLARRAVPVPPDLPVAEAVRRAAEAGARAVVVVASDGRPVALVEEAAVTAMPAGRRPWVTVADVSRRLDDGLVLPADAAGEDLLAALQRRPAPEYLLVDPQGRLVGVLSLADVERALAPR